ncbi:MAG: hypothetical protein IJC48_00265 [Clostridia bacterium]|nr:hypothetical protein [Clostridia bacterium]
MKKRNETLLKWLNEGSETLDQEMMESLEGDYLAGDEKQETAVTKKDESSRFHMIIRSAYIRISTAFSVVLCIALIAILMYTVMDMPYFGNADTLVESEVSEFYIEHTLEHTGAVNVISGIILNFRGFDTLGEAHVLFIAVCSVMILLHIHPTEHGAHLMAYEYDDASEEPHDDDILLTGVRVLFPLIVMFGIYIILNGNLSPGGGFSGGAVIGAGLILYLSVYGYIRTRRFFTMRTFRILTTIALISYTCSKTFHFVTGANDIKAMIGIGTPGTIFSGGLLLPLNIFVGLVVACTMYALFTMFRKGDF